MALYVRDKELEVLPPLDPLLKELDCGNNKLTSLPALPATLKYLDCAANLLTALPDLPNGLNHLECNHNKLTSLPELPENLQHLECGENDITVLPMLPNLITLECYTNNLSVLPELPESLEHLNCSSNNLTSLPPLPQGLKSLNYSHNNIILTELPEVAFLYCAGNNLTTLPPVKKTLQGLICSRNKLTFIPELPNIQGVFLINNNQLTSIPPLSNRIVKLNCSDNLIESLPPLPRDLKYLMCSNNKLRTLPELPEKVEYLSCDGNNFEEPYKTFIEDYIAIFNSHPEKIIDAIDVLREQIKSHLNPSNLWKGFTQSDVSKFDVIFEAQASEYALCPVCLRYVERSEACMYMKHKCKDTAGFYHKNLYEKFKNDEGYIGWCTICGRISKGHRHYKLSTYASHIPLESGGDPFEKDCRISNGGGGLPEKLARFRRFREYALELQDDIGSKPEKVALEELAEEVFNAPLRREKKLLTKIQEDKKWNINMKNFPNNVRNANANANAQNIPFTGKLPTFLNKGRNNVMMNDDVPVLQFEHTQLDGTIQTHSVGQETLEDFIKGATKNFGEDSFGFCFMYPRCNSKLHPAEIHTHIPEEIYIPYKKKFNKKFKTMVGGGNILVEMDDAVCVKMKGGKRTLKKRAKANRKTRREKSKR